MKSRTDVSDSEESSRQDVAFIPLPKRASAAHRQTILDVIRYSKEIGFIPVTARKTLKFAGNYYAKLFSAWYRSRIFLSLYPLIGGIVSPSNRWRESDPYVLHLLRRFQTATRSILYMNDLPIEQNIAASNPVDKKAYTLERKILECFDILCVCNKNVREMLMQRYGFDRDRFVEFEILDYGVNFTPTMRKSRSEGSWTIAYTGSCNTRHIGSWLKDLPHSSNVRFDFFGPGCDWVSDRSDITYKGMLATTEDLVRYISRKADFGIIASSEGYRRFYEYTSTSKFATYVASGIPVLVRADYKYIASLVKKHGVGLVFDTYEEIPGLIKSITWSEYTDLRNKCLRLGLSLKGGSFFKAAVRLAMRKLLVN